MTSASADRRTPHRPARQLLTLTAVVTSALSVAVIAGVLAARTPDPPTPSRLAADRACPEDPDRADDGAPERFDGRLVAELVGQAMEPVTLALRGDGSGEGVLGERGGRLLRIAAGSITDEVVLDLTDDTTQDGDGGLLGVAYDPDGGWLYVYRATRARDDVVTAHRLDDRGRPQAGEGRVVLLVERVPSKQHHGGSFVFGPDGMLYVGFGDGGGLGDPRENAQDPTSLLGKVLRLDPTPDAAQPYRVPPDNPFVGRTGWRPEIWVLGVRNPFRMGLDEATGDIWLGDVGQSCWEEIDRLVTGADGSGGSNLGWDRKEGDAPFEGGAIPGRELRPTHTYSHRRGGCAVVSGYVPRTPTATDLHDLLLFTDYCDGRLLALRTGAVSGEGTQVVDLGVELENPVAIVPGPAGRPWVLSLAGQVYELVAA